jgi:hypothetical protein
MRKHKQLFASTLVFLFLILGTVLVILYGKGYRIGNLFNGHPTVSKTGLLVATSKPDGAQVYINGNLTTATSDTLDLLPGQYTVKISKDGYLPWEKTVVIKKEVVTKADALLFPTAPRLESITSSGVDQPLLDPSRHRIAFRIASQSAKKNGLYVLDMSGNSVLTLQSSTRQLADDVTDVFSQSNYSWSPDGQEIVASIAATEDTASYYLLNAGSFNDPPQNITALLSTTEDQWNADKAEKELARMNSLRKPLKLLINSNFHIISWSPDETRIMYMASRSAELPVIINPRRIGIDTVREDRNIKQYSVYVYDIQDDVNMQVFAVDQTVCDKLPSVDLCHPPIQWFSDSDHLITVQDKKINIMEWDGTNSTTVYAGPFIDDYVFPWPDGSKVVILTNFNSQGVAPNLYTIGLK